MDVILIKDVDALGEQGQIMSVSDGYARNFLFPQKMAIRSSDGALRDLESRRSQLEAKAEKRYQDNLAKANSIQQLGEIVLEASVGEEGKLFGTITPKDLSAVVEAKTNVKVDRRNIILNKPINRLGDYELTLRLSPRVSTKLGLHVAPENLEVLSPDAKEAYFELRPQARKDEPQQPDAPMGEMDWGEDE